MPPRRGKRPREAIAPDTDTSNRDGATGDDAAAAPPPSIPCQLRAHFAASAGGACVLEGGGASLASLAARPLVLLFPPGGGEEGQGLWGAALCGGRVVAGGAAEGAVLRLRAAPVWVRGRPLCRLLPSLLPPRLRAHVLGAARGLAALADAWGDACGADELPAALTGVARALLLGLPAVRLEAVSGAFPVLSGAGAAAAAPVEVAAEERAARAARHWEALQPLLPANVLSVTADGAKPDSVAARLQTCVWCVVRYPEGLPAAAAAADESAAAAAFVLPDFLILQGLSVAVGHRQLPPHARRLAAAAVRRQCDAGVLRLPPLQGPDGRACLCVVEAEDAESAGAAGEAGAFFGSAADLAG